LDELSGGVDDDGSTVAAVERVRVAVLRLKGTVDEASTMAAQLAASRRHRILCVDRHRRRRLPQTPATADVEGCPTSPQRPQGDDM